jgi:hypothetical protein
MPTPREAEAFCRELINMIRERGIEPDNAVPALLVAAAKLAVANERALESLMEIVGTAFVEEVMHQRKQHLSS